MGRRTLVNASWDGCLDYLTSVSLAVRVVEEDGDKEVAALRSAIDKQLARHDQLSAERRERRTAQLLANAKVKRRDVQGDGVVDLLAKDALALAGQDREAPFFKRLFPLRPSDLIKMALPGELPEWRELFRRLQEAETPAELKKAHGEALKTAIANGEAALKEREDAYSAMGQTAARCQGFREDVDRVLAGIEAALLTLEHKRRLPGTWADSFFPETPSKGKKGNKNDPALKDPISPALEP